MSGPNGVGPVLARISEIQNQLGAVVGDGTLAGGPLALPAVPASPLAPSTSFASALANASGTGGPVSSAPPPSGWQIPWLGGKAPAAPTAAKAGNAGTSPAAGIAGSGVPATAGSDVVWPLHGTISQRFGPTTCTLEPPATINGHHYAHYHDGLDIAAAEGSPVQSMAAGTVEYAGRYPDGAVVVRVRNADGSVALYGHLQPGLDVKTGDGVTAGEKLGEVGVTGHTTGPHLHLELTVHGRNIDPLPVLRSGHLPGDVQAATAASSGSWAAASPLAADDGRLTQAALDRFDRVAASIPYHAQIRDAAVRAGIDPAFLASLVKAESAFRADAVSSAGAQGLCQLMPSTARSLGVKNPFDPVQNLRAGARYIATNLRIYGRADLALAAYHDGKGAVAAAGGVPDYPVTHGYITTILSYWTHYREAAS